MIKILESTTRPIKDHLFTAEGREVAVVERDDDTVIYRLPGASAESVGTVGQDVFLLIQLDFEAGLKALRTWGGDRRTHGAQVGLSFGGHTFCYFGGNLCVRFYKQGGHTAWYAPVTVEQARDIKHGRAELRYIKRTRRFRIVEL